LKHDEMATEAKRFFGSPPARGRGLKPDREVSPKAGLRSSPPARGRGLKREGPVRVVDDSGCRPPRGGVD